ncbi:hypothetical protein GE061_014221 [Apolygus lucorum]|uniref:Uncharacterized protein n=1 Tax=Apolygus lucorum TaxID=248454 RepID=A0A8S9XQ94_APOLU|nr:hypothetical protein GE061_014221 [Apolygus lucorum]
MLSIPRLLQVSPSTAASFRPAADYQDDCGSRDSKPEAQFFQVHLRCNFVIADKPPIRFEFPRFIEHEARAIFILNKDKFRDGFSAFS